MCEIKIRVSREAELDEMKHGRYRYSTLVEVDEHLLHLQSDVSRVDFIISRSDKTLDFEDV